MGSDDLGDGLLESLGVAGGDDVDELVHLRDFLIIEICGGSILYFLPERLGQA